MIRRPLISPIKAPTASVISIVSTTLGKIVTSSGGTGMPRVNRRPAIMPDTPTIEPTERSIPAVRMTNVSPTDMTSSGAATRNVPAATTPHSDPASAPEVNDASPTVNT